ncbi:MAG TPA: hypothetical protein VNJ01_08865 [Bacteriovoracaceae bacterium]|nr:hypothetical protein [Bacteriovoracaceae bacterium]
MPTQKCYMNGSLGLLATNSMTNWGFMRVSGVESLTGLYADVSPKSIDRPSLIGDDESSAIYLTETDTRCGDYIQFFKGQKYFPERSLT